MLGLDVTVINTDVPLSIEQRCCINVMYCGATRVWALLVEQAAELRKMMAVVEYFGSTPDDKGVSAKPRKSVG